MIIVMKCHMVKRKAMKLHAEAIIYPQFLLLLMVLLVICCQHAQEKKQYAHRSCSLTDLLLLTAVCDCTGIYVPALNIFSVCPLTKVLKIAVYSRKASIHIKCNYDRIIKVCSL